MRVDVKISNVRRLRAKSFVDRALARVVSLPPARTAGRYVFTSAARARARACVRVRVRVCVRL